VAACEAGGVGRVRDPWPSTDDGLVALQVRLATEAGTALGAAPLAVGSVVRVGGCFVAFARGEQGPGHPGDRAWAAAVTWDRRTDGVVAEHVVADRVPASYAPGLLARREGPILAAAIGGLDPWPDVVLVDATGFDHPRTAGLALHVGAVLDVPTVGVTHRGLVVRGDPPDRLTRRGDAAPVELDGVEVAAWVCTRTGVRPLLVHAAWRTDVPTAVEVVLLASSDRARTPAPLQEARRVARTTRHRLG
jgi:deoxyribonuclease V